MFFTMNPTTPPQLPRKVYLRRKEVQDAVGGARQFQCLERSGELRGVRLPGYTFKHYPRAAVQAVLEKLFGK